MERTEITNYDDLPTRIPAKELSTLLKVSSSLASTMDLNQVLQIAIENSTSILGLETGAIYTIENRELYLGATTPPLPPYFPDELRLAKLCDHPHLNRTVSQKKPVYLEDARVADLSPAEKIIVDTRQLISILYFPLLLKEEVIGAFIVGTTNEIRGSLPARLTCAIFFPTR
ncbi:MAG: GAF domain-containing protein [Holophaga sp.]|nr:GAF domain-containing protein [Holophaga sp.]